MNGFVAIERIINSIRIKREIKEFQKRLDSFILMPNSELSALSDEDLLTAANSRIERRLEGICDTADMINALNPSQWVFRVCFLYDTEVQNGGLCQFFVNESRKAAPYLIECLSAVSAHEHKDLFDAFASENRIDLNELSFFDMDDWEQYDELYNSYPFEDFDAAYFELPPIETSLSKFVRAHLRDF